MEVSAIASLGSSSVLDGASRATSGALLDGPFGSMVDKFLREGQQAQAKADRAVIDLATGKTENIHEVMLAITKAELTFRTFLQIRNRVTEAYQEITRMAV